VQIRSLVLATLILLVLFLALAFYGPVGSDWFWTFDPVADRLIAGHTSLYDAQGGEFYNAPWAMLIIAPLAQLPIRAGQAGLTVLTLIALMTVARQYTNNPLLLALSLTSAYVVDHVLRGQVDAFALAGAVLGVWAVQNKRPLVLSLAFWLMLIKPINISLAIALLTVYTLRHWAWRDWMVVGSIPVLSVPLSGLFIGLDWPLRYFNHLQTTPPWPGFAITSLWDILGVWAVIPALALLIIFLRSALQSGPSYGILALALSINLLIANYANDNHYVLLIPAWLWLVERRRSYALLYPLSWLPLTRIWGIAPELAYAALLTVGLLFEQQLAYRKLATYHHPKGETL